MNRLEGMRAIVTGAGSGIGRAGALRFAREGATMLLVGRTASKIEGVAEEIRNAGGSAITFAADAAEEENVKEMVDRSLRDLGGLEVFFGNAFTWIGSKPLFEHTVEQWEEVLRVNLIGSFLAVKHAGSHMRASGKGSIILTSSVASLRANAGDAAYSASKAGINSLAALAANELSGTGVRVNSLVPGLIETEGTQFLFDAARARGVEHKLGRLNPLKRPGQPAEIAAMAAFLASDDASYVNGQTLIVDGGFSSSHPYGRLG